MHENANFFEVSMVFIYQPILVRICIFHAFFMHVLSISSRIERFIPEMHEKYRKNAKKCKCLRVFDDFGPVNSALGICIYFELFHIFKRVGCGGFRGGSMWSLVPVVPFYQFIDGLVCIPRMLGHPSLYLFLVQRTALVEKKRLNLARHMGGLHLVDNILAVGATAMAWHAHM